MCGLAGLVRIGTGVLNESDRTIARRMTDAVEHRGPDETVAFENERGYFGFQRLSLLAPADGRQPFVHGDGDVVLMVNGEIYNHKELRNKLTGSEFRSRSDCEVLLHGYLEHGLPYLEKVRGMFAFALLDNRRRQLILGRDRFGIKPMFFHLDRSRIVFASEIKALFQHPATPRRVSWLSALADPALNLDMTLETGPINTWFDGISAVPAASTVTIDLTDGRVSETRYWDPHTAADLSRSSAGEIVEAYRDLLAASVADCLQADAEVGMLLSGGIDSAAVAAFARGTGIHTFTALTGSTVVNGDAEYSHRTAAYCSLPNHQIMFDRDRIPSPDEWRAILWSLETPQASPEHFYKSELHRFARATRPQLKAMLLGQASDEFNGGYSRKLSGGSGWPGFLANIGSMARNTRLRHFSRLEPWFTPGHGGLLRDNAWSDAGDVDVYRQFVDWKLRDIEQFNTWHEDRTAAANSVEARVPFLDHRLVELTNGVPVEMRETLFWDKRILRLALADLLPPEIVSRPKVSFYYDDDGYNNQKTFIRLMSANDSELLEDALSSEMAGRYIDRDAARTLLGDLSRDPGLPAMEYLLGVVNLGLLENMLDDLPAVDYDVHRHQIPEEVTVPNWEESAPEIARRVFESAALSDDTMLSVKADVKVFEDFRTAGVFYLAIEDSVEYRFDDDDAADWATVFSAFSTLDVPSSIREVADRSGVPVESVRSMVRTAVQERVLVPENSSLLGVG